MLQQRIHDLLVKTILAAEPQLLRVNQAVGAPQGAGFEILGVDVLVDAQLRAYLLEVNLYPSLAVDTPLDKFIKTKLLCDAFQLIGLRCVDLQQAAAERRYEKMKQQREAEKRDESRQGKEKDAAWGRVMDEDVQYEMQQSSVILDDEYGDDDEDDEDEHDEIEDEEEDEELPSLDLLQLNEQQLTLICEFEEEQDRIGHFQRLFPRSRSWRQYRQLFPTTWNSSSPNRLLARWLQLPRRTARELLLELRRNPSRISK